MKAMLLERLGQPLVLTDVSDPIPGKGQLRLKVEACAVCRTDLHLIDGDLPNPALPVVPGHEIVGIVDLVGDGIDRSMVGRRVGVAWLAHSCGTCPFCQRNTENLCDNPDFTGYTVNGGYAAYAIAHADYTFELDAKADPVALAPLLCAGLIGWRCLRKVPLAQAIGLYGFGAAAHIVSQICVSQGRRVFAFTRPLDETGQQFALSLGCEWAGPSDQVPPVLLDAAIIFAPSGELVPAALKAVRKGGQVVCGGIHMSDIPSIPYRLLWEEREVLSVANMTREDGHSFFAALKHANVRVESKAYPLERANDALADLRSGQLTGAAVLVPGPQSPADISI